MECSSGRDVNDIIQFFSIIILHHKAILIVLARYANMILTMHSITDLHIFKKIFLHVPWGPNTLMQAPEDGLSRQFYIDARDEFLKFGLPA